MLHSLRNWLGMLRGDQKFCWINWHNDTRSTDIHYLNTPFPDGGFHRHQFRRLSEEGVNNLIRELKADGWQQYLSSPNREGWSRGFMRVSNPDNSVEQCVLTSATTSQKGGEESKPEREGLFRIGSSNESLITGDMWRLSYAETLQYLENEQWKLVKEEDYPFGRGPLNRRLHLRYYTRPRA